MEKDGLDAVRQELAAESARSLGHAAERMVAALTELRAWDDAGHPRHDARRAELVDAAGERAWFFVIQRETLGFFDGAHALDLYQVPAEVRARMGTVRPLPPPPPDEWPY